MTSFFDADFTDLVVAAARYGRATLRANALLVAEGRAITCPVCFATSHNPNDIREGFCGNCHDWTSRPLDRRVPRRHNAHHCAVCTAAQWRDLDGSGTRFACERKGTWTLRHLQTAPVNRPDSGAGWYLYGPGIIAMLIDNDIERALHLAAEYLLFADRHTITRGEQPTDIEQEHSGHQVS